jgi:hypothetical protein
MKFPGEPCRCELVKWRDEWEAFKACMTEQGASSFARGAEAMRTALSPYVAWGLDLVGVDGSTEAGRDDAFAKLYDAAKASGKLVKE